MARFNRKNSIGDLLFSRITLGILAVLCVYMAFSVFTRYKVAKEMEMRHATAAASHAELMERKEQLEEKVRYLQDDAGVEAEIRKHFDVAKEGEQVVIIVDKEDNEAASTDTTSTVPTPEKKWYQFWR